MVGFGFWGLFVCRKGRGQCSLVKNSLVRSFAPMKLIEFYEKNIYVFDCFCVG